MQMTVGRVEALCRSARSFLVEAMIELMEAAEPAENTGRICEMMAADLKLIAERPQGKLMIDRS